MAAADVRHFGPGFQFGHHVVEGRQPFGDQMGFVARAEEAFGAAEHARMVIAPGQGAVAAHCFDQFVLVMEKRRDHADSARHINR
ncbi:hypothetical protein D3C86_1934530 [compost metagenome]